MSVSGQFHSMKVDRGEEVILCERILALVTMHMLRACCCAI